MSTLPTAANTGQPDTTPFFFVADLLALDLVNSELVVRGKPRDLLTTPADAARWWELAQLCHPARPVVRQPGGQALAVNGQLLEQLRALRGALRGFFGALVDAAPPRAEDLHVINAVRQAGRQMVEAPAGEVRVIYATDEAHGAVLLPIAVSALSWVSSGERQRLHRCANPRCILFFYDTTKSATRRWCSLGCMDRARSAQRYQQAKHPSRTDA